MIGKKLLTLYGIVGGALALAFLFGYTVGDISTQNGSTGNIEAGTGNSDCVRPDYFFTEYTRFYSPEYDLDGDGLIDSWEVTYDLDPNDSSDAELDPDSDGYTNLEEFRAYTDPQSARDHPGAVIEIVDEGFDCFYTAEMGLINDDDLLDILIRDPSEGFLPAVRDFVMIQQADHSFLIEDAGNHEIPELTSIQSTLWLTELNMDQSKDIALIGLSEFIPSVNDQLIFGPRWFGDDLARGIDFDIVPRFHKEVDNETHEFFEALFGWIQNGDYFEDNAPVLATVPQVLDLSWFRDESGNVPGDSEPLSRRPLPADCNAALVQCFDVTADAGDPERFSANETFAVSYTETPYLVDLSDMYNDPDELDLYFLARAAFSESFEWPLKDYSVFNQDALRLARNEMRNVRYSGVMFVPSNESTAIFNVLREYLDSSVFFEVGPGGVRGVAPWHVWPHEIDTRRDILAMGTVYYIRHVLDYLSDRYMSRPADLYEQ